MYQMTLDLKPKQQVEQQFSKLDLPFFKFSEHFEFSGRIRTNPEGSFQYRYGIKVSPADRRIFVKKYKLDD